MHKAIHLYTLPKENAMHSLFPWAVLFTAAKRTYPKTEKKNTPETLPFW